MNINVHHHDGVMFVKSQADTGITYISVDPTDVDQVSTDLLVRHGDPESGRCGYYPVWLLLASETTRARQAYKRSKQPPSENWVDRAKKTLADAGASFIH